MKFSNMSKSFVAVAFIAMSLSAFASNKGSFTVSSPFMVSGKQLEAGGYSVRWDGAGADTQVSFLKDNKIVATAPAHLIDLSVPAANDSTVVKKNDDGTRSLTQIRFGGKKTALSFDGVELQTSSAK